jgi:hypothetical protein
MLAGSVLVPKRIGAGPFQRMLDITHAVHHAFGERPMERWIISRSLGNGPNERPWLSWKFHIRDRTPTA